MGDEQYLKLFYQMCIEYHKARYNKGFRYIRLEADGRFYAVSSLGSSTKLTKEEISKDPKIVAEEAVKEEEDRKIKIQEQREKMQLEKERLYQEGVKKRQEENEKIEYKNYLRLKAKFENIKQE